MNTLSYEMSENSTTGESGVGQLLRARRTFSAVDAGDVPDPKYYERAGISYDRDVVYYCPKPFGKLFRFVGLLYYVYTAIFRRLHYWGFLDCEEGGSRSQAARRLRNWHLAFWKDRHCRWRTKLTERDRSFRDCGTCNLPQAA